mmetsp:Transcript_41968/g.132655  ORF Transcript_41968/g.132655 Transcript_41968/m.132655 type:complete len:369 (-) Transcript_41968:357-1463(-)
MDFRSPRDLPRRNGSGWKTMNSLTSSHDSLSKLGALNDEQERLQARVSGNVQHMTVNEKKTPCSVDLAMVAAVLLHLLDELRPHQAILLGQWAERLLQATLHALEAAHVDVSLRQLHHGPQVLRELHDPVLNIHRLALLVLHLVGDRVVVPELIRVLCLHLLPLLVVEQGCREGHAEEHPSQALELASGALVVEEMAQERAEGRNACARRQHDDVRARVLGQQHLGAGGAREQHLVAGLEVADVGGADAAVDLRGIGELLVRQRDVGVLAPALALDLDDALHDQGHGLVGLVVAGCGRRDGVEADLRGDLTLLVGARRDHADGLSLKVGQVLVVAHDDVGGLPIDEPGLRGDGLLGNGAALVWCLGRE